MKNFLISLRMTVLLLALCSGLYTSIVWGIGQTLFPQKAEGSLIERDGEIIGSELIGQSFKSSRYFHGRPSAVDYNASGSAGSNLGPTNPALFARIADTVTSASLLDNLTTATIASDRIYASGSGLDPDIAPKNAYQQTARIARERGLRPAQVEEIIQRHITSPLLGLLGTSRVNVLKINLALDAKSSATTPSTNKDF